MNPQTLPKNLDNYQDKKDFFAEEGIKNISAFQDTLKRIHIRLISEGYKIENGNLIPPALNKSATIKPS